MTSDYDWTQFKKQVFIAASTKAVFDAWAKPGEIVKWFIARADYLSPTGELREAGESIQAGDRYHWHWHQDLEAHGEILTVQDGSRLRFTFGNKEPDSDEKIVVTVKVSETERGDTLLELTQENMADTPEAHANWHLSCNLGWSFFMTNLKAFLEHGVDLREADPARADSSRAVSLVG